MNKPSDNIDVGDHTIYIHLYMRFTLLCIQFEVIYNESIRNSQRWRAVNAMSPG